MKKVLLCFMTLISFNSYSAELMDQAKDEIVKKYIKTELGFDVTKVRYTHPEGIYTNINKLGIEILEAVFDSDNITIEELHIQTNKSIELNCIGYFYSNEEKIVLGLENCSIWNNNRSKYPYDIGGSRNL